MSTTTATAVRAGTLPRVNLLPSEIAESVRFRNAQAVMALALGLSLAVVGGLWYLGANDASDAQTQLDAARVQATQLQAQEASFADVPKVYATATAVDAQLNQAMSQEIRYSFVLKDLSLSMPPGVWLKTLVVSQAVDQPGSVKGAWGTQALGTLVFTGQAGSLPQVAGWLDSLAKQSTYTDPYLTGAQQTTTAEVPGYSFTSSVAVTQKALSNRFTAKAGS